jgi:hypothetical protein
MSRYPNAEWVPWKYNSEYGPTYYKGTNKPEAVVLHVMQGYLRTARTWAAQGHYGASWHFSIGVDGTVLQHLEFEDGGYHAGISVNSKKPTWPLWKGHEVNVNNYTIGIEHEGFSGEGFTDEQRRASKDLCAWLAAELGIPFARDRFPPHADIDIVNRPLDFAPPAQREEFYKFLFEEEDMGMSDNDILAVFGSTERLPSGEADHATRLANAKFRYQQSIETGNSPFDVASQSKSDIKAHVDNHAAGVSGPVAKHTHKPGEVA